MFFSVLWFKHPFYLFLYFNLQRNFNKVYNSFCKQPGRGVAQSLGLIIPRGQSFSGHVVQAKMRVQLLFASVRHRGELTERGCGIYRDQATRGEYDIVSSLIVLKYFFFQLKRWRSGLSNALSPCPGCLKWLRYG